MSAMSPTQPGLSSTPALPGLARSVQQCRQRAAGQRNILLARFWRAYARDYGLVDLYRQPGHQGPGFPVEPAGNLPGQGKEAPAPSALMTGDVPLVANSGYSHYTLL